jgi:hypothetical protein
MIAVSDGQYDFSNGQYRFQRRRFMPKQFFDRHQPGRVSQPPAETTLSSNSSAVEEIWSSWRYEKSSAVSEGRAADETLPGPRAAPVNSASPAELVSQFKRRGEYERALDVVLSEIEREEAEGRSHAAERLSVPWYYWEAASIYRKLKRYGEEIALIRRFANNYNLHFRVFSKRYRSTRGATHAWATNFLERVDAARAAAAARAEDGKLKPSEKFLK